MFLIRTLTAGRTNLHTIFALFHLSEVRNADLGCDTENKAQELIRVVRINHSQSKIFSDESFGHPVLGGLRLLPLGQVYIVLTSGLATDPLLDVEFAIIAFFSVTYMCKLLCTANPVSLVDKNE